MKAKWTKVNKDWWALELLDVKAPVEGRVLGSRANNRATQGATQVSPVRAELRPDTVTHYLAGPRILSVAADGRPVLVPARDKAAVEELLGAKDPDGKE